jgi:hypothetical protein
VTTRHNPPAFPNLAPNSCGPHIDKRDGMTLRDWFATHAPEPPITWWGHGSRDCSGRAKWNYQYADAMIVERLRDNRWDDAPGHPGVTEAEVRQ